MKKVIIHFGYQKTGSSALQEILQKNSDFLKDNNIFYPKSLLGFPAQQEMAWSLMKNKKPWMNVDYSSKEVFQHFIKEFEDSNCSTMILSSEDLTFLEKEPDALLKIKEYLSDYIIQCFCYIREPIDFLLSLYGHRLRAFNTQDTFIDDFLNERNIRVADYMFRLKAWEDVFGVENIKVSPFSPKKFHKGNIAHDFFYNIDIDLDIEFEAHRSNENIHPWLLSSLLEASKGNVQNQDEILELMYKLTAVLPKVSVKDHLLTKRELSYLEKIYKPSKMGIKNKYGISFNS